MQTMEVICAWCQKKLGERETASDIERPVSHGICFSCLVNILAAEKKPLRKYLDIFQGPVLVIDSEARVVAANRQGCALLGKEPADFEDRLTGDAIECSYAHLPGGCGDTIHCKTCTIRSTITDTLRTGKSHLKVPAYQDIHTLTGNRQVRFLISTEKAGDAVLLRIDDLSDTEEINK